MACIEACPTQALNEYRIDAGKCISYLTIEHRGNFEDGQSELHDWIYGCDVCQEVCPWNISFSKVSETLLLGWISGDEAKFMETLKMNVVADMCTTVLRKFLADPYVPKPKSCIL